MSLQVQTSACALCGTHGARCQSEDEHGRVHCCYTGAAPALRLSYGERENLLREGRAWIDPAGQLHEGQPDSDTFAEIFPAVADAASVRRALQAANDAALEVGRLLQALESAQATARQTHEQAKIAAAAEWSRRNLEPHATANDARIKAYFAEL